MVQYTDLKNDLSSLIGKTEIAKQSEACRVAGYVSLSLESNVAAHVQGTLRNIGKLDLPSLSQEQRENSRYLREVLLRFLETDQLRPEELYFLWKKLYPITIPTTAQSTHPP
ncbi:MAG: hypothetical protein A2822_00795 [Candidatus Staskawiczbacteria bacterium RIFCSPHIGHO2_01_FULL_41_41]|uniref:Uncharacterized protein n=1 Tax=Candidatus Staskawiczbacteria bacterium RIFCSPHIGHO2_01_FULL_41_41 TaxID=1802203 RepID=A0A1G2HRI5_9BACT|nr:MAG: hypothetical protein A2822_00795 [Candidatus Staskawiczbacteria bacterium RIFCSPHIGHO2_01_FULL_41_41]HLD79655.1 hypothetical protein [Candidatus Nanoarchaeia archaeon]